MASQLEASTPLEKAQQYYEAALCLMRSGQLEEAILNLRESLFFAPENANPVAAMAECYVLLCDLQSAVRHYRQVMWILQKPFRESEAQKRREQCPFLCLFQGNAELEKEEDQSAMVERLNTYLVSEISPGKSSISVPTATKPGGKLPPGAFSNTSGVGIVAVQHRLGGLLDALGLALFRMSDFTQALRYAEDALKVVSRGRQPTIELHRCVYLIALQREEEAEFKLEDHLKTYPDFAVQSGALLVQLYCDRQAFRPARMLLENFMADIRKEHCLTIANHIFYAKYNRYRTKALEKLDIGTITKCIEVFPNDVELMFTRAKLFIAEGNHKRSVRDLFRCIKETNGTHKEAVETMTSVLFKIGSNLDGEEGIQEAISYYSESLKWRSDNTLVLLARADCYVKLEDYESALQDYRNILQIDPDHMDATSRIAFLHDMWGGKLYKLGRVADAEKEFSNAIKTCDTEPLFYYHRALCRFELNETRYGLRDVLSVQELQPKDPLLQDFLVRYLGSRQVPKTTKAFQEREQKGLVHRGVNGDVKLIHAHLPGDYDRTTQRAIAIFGQPSGRQIKEEDDAVRNRNGQLPRSGAGGPSDRRLPQHPDRVPIRPNNGRTVLPAVRTQPSISDRPDVHLELNLLSAARMPTTKKKTPRTTHPIRKSPPSPSSIVIKSNGQKPAQSPPRAVVEVPFTPSDDVPTSLAMTTGSRNDEIGSQSLHAPSVGETQLPQLPSSPRGDESIDIMPDDEGTVAPTPVLVNGEVQAGSAAVVAADP